MKWNWQQDDWPQFSFQEEKISKLETEFQHQTGQIFGAFLHLSDEDRNQLRVDLISNEALQTSAIEGEHLDRESLQSSIRRHFGLQTDERRVPAREAGIAELMANLFAHFNEPISHETLFGWHRMLMNGRTDLQSVGSYRTDDSPMQIVSGPLHAPRIHFEAPPSRSVEAEMERFISWFNASQTENMPALTRAGIAHLYFESIHPFEDGNGRIGRALSEKVLAQSVQKPTLIALASQIHKKRKRYYSALAEASQDNEVTAWLNYFAKTILDAVQDTHGQIEFLIEKTRLFSKLEGRLNPRQEKCLLRVFAEGPEGFVGGLSAKNYMTITGAHRVTATRDMGDLVEKGALKRTGERKSTRYWLNVPNSGIAKSEF